MDRIYVPGKGPFNPKIVIVGESPSYDEEKTLTPFTGPSGKFLNQLLHEAGIRREECWVTNVCKYFVPFDSEKKLPFRKRAIAHGIDWDSQINDLYSEISQLSPNIVIALGSTALHALSGKNPIQKWRGSIVNAFGFKCIGTYHPAHILHQEGEVKGYWNKPVMVFDLIRARKQSEFKEFRLPARNLHVASNSTELYDFIKRNAGNRNPAIDIEARNCIPICIGISFNPNEGITVPLWSNAISNSDIASTWGYLTNFLANHEVVGQNFGYDRDKLRRLGFVIKGLHSDTMLKAFCINPELPKNLAFNTSIYTEEPYYKDEGMYEGNEQDLFIGCARDACVTKEIDIAQQRDIEELGIDNYYRKFILQLHEVYFYNEKLNAIEQNGFRVEESIRSDLIRKYITWDEKIRYELYQLTGSYINSSSPKQIAELLYQTLDIPGRSGTGEEVLTQLLNNTVKDAKKRRIIELILEDRRVKKTLSSYLYSPTDFDGRMRTSYFICLETGRSATSQQDPPIRPAIEYKEGSVKKKQSRGMAFQTITKHGDIGNDVRTMLVADEGCILLQADSSQAEARVVALLSDDEEMLRMYNEHDIHALTASWFFGGCEDDYSKKKIGHETPQRFAGKTLRHAGNLGAGKRRAAIELNTQARKYKIDFNISEHLAGKALDIFHRKCPNIRSVFHAEVIELVKKSRRLIAPVPYGIDASIGGTRIFFERDGEELYRQAFSYIPQRTVSENIKGAAIRIQKRCNWIKILVESHDSLVIQCKEDRKMETAKIMREEFERPIDFSTCSLKRGTLVIPCDVETGYNYNDMKKLVIE